MNFGRRFVELQLSGVQACIDLLERHSLGLDHHDLHPDKLQNHHTREKHEYVARREVRHQLWKKTCDYCRAHPMCEATKRLTLGSVSIWKDFRYVHPDDRTLPNCMCRNKGEDASRT